MQGASITSKGGTENKDEAVSQTDAERLFKQKPYLSCDLRFSTRTIIAVLKYELFKPKCADVAFSPLRWVRRRRRLPLSRFVMPVVCRRYARLATFDQTIMTCVFQSFYLSDWQGRCAFGGHGVVI